MTDFHRRKSEPGALATSDALGRTGRLAGRVALWGCVLLLLLRGIASVLAGTTPQPARTPTVVTVTQPAAPASRGTGR